ncbi:hypothetical protein AGMMS50212_11950 [Spirochaetia bacterium]|nr:hypothetical protein AGMMS50212_11950 [Spirochaetia bacterium]
MEKAKDGGSKIVIKKFYIIAVLLFFAGYVNISADINEVCDKLSKNNIVKGNFIQRKEAAAVKRIFVSTGNFVIAKDLGIILQTLTPVSSTLIAGPNSLTQRNDSGVQSRIDAKGNRSFLWIAETISSIFTGDITTLQKSFFVEFIESNGEWVMNLTPKHREMKAFAEKVIIKGGESSGRHVINEVTMIEQKSGSTELFFYESVFPEMLTPDEIQLFETN